MDELVFEKVPDRQEVFEINRIAWEFYKKFAEISATDAYPNMVNTILDEVSRIEKAHPYELCRRQLIEYVAIFDGYYRQSHGESEGQDGL